MARKTQTIRRKTRKHVTTAHTSPNQTDPLTLARALGLPCFMRVVDPDEARKPRHR
jgi:hypothetical protein